MDPLTAASRMANAGLAAQSQRMRVAAENLANAHATASVPGGDPYRRKTVVFRVDPETSGVAVAETSTDPRPFNRELRPGHPAADADGYVKLPNVDVLVETADLREANRSYLANLQVIRQSRDAVQATLDLLRMS
jgi:flagellar basal-body rod protein FlgC